MWPWDEVPRTLAENAGLNATDVVYNLYAAHAAGEKNAGVDVSSEKSWVVGPCLSSISISTLHEYSHYDKVHETT
jgi:chaperonin GroEL (HSP60 family)